MHANSSVSILTQYRSKAKYFINWVICYSYSGIKNQAQPHGTHLRLEPLLYIPWDGYILVGYNIVPIFCLLQIAVMVVMSMMER